MTMDPAQALPPESMVTTWRTEVTEPDQSMPDFVSGMTDFDYSAMLDSVPAVAADFLLSYGRLRELCGPEDEGVVDLLIAHELALEVFMRREKAGLVDTSLQAIAVLPHVTL